MQKKSLTQILHNDSLKWAYDICKWVYLKSSSIVFYAVRGGVSLRPLQNKVVATAYNGKRYDDNTRYIVEKIHELDPDIPIVWLMDVKASYELPSYIKGVRCWSQYKFLRRIYEYCTAKVVLDTHLIDTFYKKRRGQLFIETWHGGLGIKKIELDVEKYTKLKSHVRKIQNTSRQADIFISNSDHLSNIYRRAFKRKKKIWKCGYPKNDELVTISEDELKAIRKKVRDYFHVPEDYKLITYAPTFRDETRIKGIFKKEWYDLDPEGTVEAFKKMFGDEKCLLLYKLHPFLIANSEEYLSELQTSVQNATKYPDMQELIMASDACISDYSSCIFDAALFGMPCFTFANDFEEYKGDRGVYFEMEDLPFPYAKNVEELHYNILHFDKEQYDADWKAFAETVGLKETGHAGRDIAEYICRFIKKKRER